MHISYWYNYLLLPISYKLYFLHDGKGKPKHGFGCTWVFLFSAHCLPIKTPEFLATFGFTAF